MSVAQKAAASIEGQAAAAQTGAEGIRRKAMGFAEQTLASSFDLAEELMHAKDVEEMTRLQADFVQHQMELLSCRHRNWGRRRRGPPGGWRPCRRRHRRPHGRLANSRGMQLLILCDAIIPLRRTIACLYL